MFILDSSTRVLSSEFIKMLNVTVKFLTGTDIDGGKVRVGILLYSTRVYEQFHLNTYTTQQGIISAISKMHRLLGDANIADAIRAAKDTMFTIENGDRPEVPNVAVVITEGVSNIHSMKAIREADKAKEAGIRLFVIGIGVEDGAELDYIASQPMEENRISIKDFDDLRWNIDMMYLSLCPGNLTSCTCASKISNNIMSNFASCLHSFALKLYYILLVL